MSGAADINQNTHGACSPAVADVKGNVNITCNGIDQATVDKAVRLLNEILKDKKKLDQIRLDLDNTNRRTDQIEARQAARRVSQRQSTELVKLLVGKTPMAFRIIDVRKI